MAVILLVCMGEIGKEGKKESWGGGGGGAYSYL